MSAFTKGAKIFFEVIAPVALASYFFAVGFMEVGRFLQGQTPEGDFLMFCLRNAFVLVIVPFALLLDMFSKARGYGASDIPEFVVVKVMERLVYLTLLVMLMMEIVNR